MRKLTFLSSFAILLTNVFAMSSNTNQEKGNLSANLNRSVVVGNNKSDEIASQSQGYSSKIMNGINIAVTHNSAENSKKTQRKRKRTESLQKGVTSKPIVLSQSNREIKSAFEQYQKNPFVIGPMKQLVTTSAQKKQNYLPKGASAWKPEQIDFLLNGSLNDTRTQSEPVFLQSKAKNTIPLFNLNMMKNNGLLSRGRSLPFGVECFTSPKELARLDQKINRLKVALINQQIQIYEQRLIQIYEQRLNLLEDRRKLRELRYRDEDARKIISSISSEEESTDLSKNTKKEASTSLSKIEKKDVSTNTRESMQKDASANTIQEESLTGALDEKELGESSAKRRKKNQKESLQPEIIQDISSSTPKKEDNVSSRKSRRLEKKNRKQRTPGPYSLRSQINEINV